MMIAQRPRSVTIDSLLPTLESPSLTSKRKPRSSSYTVLPSKATSPTPLEFAGRYKIVVVGEDNCGKTCLLNSFSRRTFTMDTAVTYDDGVSTIRYGSKQVEFVMWDLSGCSDYDGLRIELYRDTDLFLVCFDIGNSESLDAAIDIWIPEIQFEEPNASFILVGCKHDLRQEYSLPTSPETSSTISPEYRHTVSKSKAEQVARDWGAKDYIECCAKTGYNIPEVFKSAAQVFLASNEDKSNAYGFKGLSMFRRRKSNDTSEIFYSSYESSTPCRFYPSYATKSYLRRASDAST
ncbi:uncharacterized protein [Clytia hemisphaerica]|uniref:Uncharacterized protein n=1 Tax=Clytia hemisphaerica TaxID=252671 RepID=A0A7M5X784_9CNID|eukprot:TCONS_00020876-protein